MVFNKIALIDDRGSYNFIDLTTNDDDVGSPMSLAACLAPAGIGLSGHIDEEDAPILESLMLLLRAIFWSAAPLGWDLLPLLLILPLILRLYILLFRSTVRKILWSAAPLGWDSLLPFVRLVHIILRSAALWEWDHIPLGVRFIFLSMAPLGWEILLILHMMLFGGTTSISLAMMVMSD